MACWVTLVSRRIRTLSRLAGVAGLKLSVKPAISANMFRVSFAGVLSVCSAFCSIGMFAAEPQTMKAVVAHEYGGPEVLKFENIPKPEPKDNQALVKVIASSVNP